MLLQRILDRNGLYPEYWCLHRVTGKYTSYRWYTHKIHEIPDYWRDTLRDVAEYCGGI